MRFVSRASRCGCWRGSRSRLGWGSRRRVALDGLTGTLWGGAVRTFPLHLAALSINSLCHFFGRPSVTGDDSRNLRWLASITLGEAWHNNHHAFPTSARHGLGRRQPDPSAWVIDALERCQLARKVVRIAPTTSRQSAASARRSTPWS